MKETLLDIDHVPTMEELKAYFHAHDFSGACYYNSAAPGQKDDLSKDDRQAVNEVKNVVKSEWDELSTKKGLKSKPLNYDSENNSLMFMRDNLSKLVGEGVFKLLDEQPEKAMEIWEQFPDELNDPQKADALFKKSVDMLMDVTDFETMASAIQKQPDARDFKDIPNNHRKQDFDRKWYHTRAKVSTESLDAMDEDVADPRTHTEAEAISDITLKDFWNSLSDEDHKILLYSMNGMTQQEIADKIGFKTHSAVTKRLAKIREKFPE